MNLEHLRAFATIVELGSFRGAAHRLNKVQSAISHSIKELESSLGITLFDRNSYRPQLTQQGRALLESAKKILQEEESLLACAQLLATGQEALVRLSVSAIFPLSQLTEQLQKNRQLYPKTEVRIIIEVLSGDFLIESGEVDLAITENQATQSNGFENIPLMKVDMIPVVARHNSLAALNKVSRADLESEPQIIVKSTHRKHDRKAGILNARNRWQVTDFATKKALIVSGLGWGSMTRHLIEQEIASQQLIALPLAVNSVALYLSYEKGADLGPASKNLIELIRSGCKSSL